MPRAAGQIDRAKNEAILDAAAEILTEKGLSAPMALIARRAKVSKQTIYNHYGAKMDLIHALVSRRVDSMTRPVAIEAAQGNAEDALAAFAEILLRFVTGPRGAAIMRLTIQSSGETPKLARDFHDTGPKATIDRLTAFMSAEMDAGRMEKGDPREAAEFFGGAAAGHKQSVALLGFPEPLADDELKALSRRIAQRFLRAYAV